MPKNKSKSLSLTDANRLYDLSVDMLGMASFDGYFVNLNPAWERTLGHSLKELYSRPFIEFVYPEDREATQKQIDRVVKGATAREFEHRFLHKNGAYTWLSWNAVPFVDERVIYIVVHNITHRKQVEHELGAHLERLAILRSVNVELSRKLDLTYVLQMSLDQAIRVSEASAGFIAISKMGSGLHLAHSLGGYPKNEVPYTEANHIVGQVVDSQTPIWIFDIELEADAYSVIPKIAGQMAVPLISHDELIGVLCVETLLSERFTSAAFDFLQLIAQHISVSVDNAQLVESLRESEERYRVMVDSASDLVYQADANGRVIYCNPIVLKTTGYTREELFSKHYLEIVDQDHQDLARKFYGRQARDGVAQTYYEVPIVSKSGDTIWVGQSAQLLKNEEKLIGFQVIARDITDRKMAEDERERLIEDLDAFAHMVAHDLKNPLNAIVGYSTFLKDFPDVTEEHREILGIITEISYKMSAVVDSLLQFAQLRSDTDVNLVYIDMGLLVSDACKRMSYMVMEFDAELVIAEEWLSAFGHEGWVEEVWVNYISNAIKYGGRPPRVELGATLQDDGMVRYWVRDSGAGLTAEQQAQLFTEFTRLKKVDIEGHGLGLAVVKRIVETLGGEVGIESEVGQGSTFYFTLSQTQAK
jgi:PAS domain S-box-containing protein